MRRTMPGRVRRRQGFSAAELVVVVAIVGVLSAVVVPRAAAYLDAVAVQGASADVAVACAAARAAAVSRNAHAAVRFDAARGRVVVHVRADTILRRDLAALHRVTLTATRDSIAFNPLGLGYGAANARIVVSRGRSADTVWVARLGRVRR
ncbi:MAG TPA: GspH/FimT family pseudopilin [Gemmatimonadaceae bacterium]|nr:GspH/FimT family pseudopilin [Gemmatimonadaceae bacterium]